jgi:4-phytase/acid phosphatase
MRTLVLAVLLALVSFGAAAGDQLERVVILSRHGIRAPMSSPAELGRYSAEPWPQWSAPSGHLTENGRIDEELLGAYYHGVYAALVPAGACDSVYLWANVTQRTIATAQALGHGLQPDCPVAVHTVGEGRDDPLFDPVAAGMVVPDYDLALAAVAGRVGNDAAAWARVYRADLMALQTLLLGSGKGEALVDVPAVLARGEGNTLVRVDGPFSRASSLSESLLMLYADGVPLDQLAGGRLTETRLFDSQAAHALDLDMQLRAPYIARLTASHLAGRLLATLAGGPDGLGDAKSKIVALVGHDGTIEELAGLLDLRWLLPGWQPDQVPPGGALRFELWRRASDGKEVVRLSFTGQSLAQLRNREPLSAARPPPTAPVFIPGCSEAGPGYDCPLDRLERRLAEATDPRR